jgi:hypothetical protein
MGPAKFRYRLSHQPRARRCRCVTDFDLAHLASTSKLRDTRGVLGLSQCRSSLLEEARAGVRELHVSLGANEQPRTQFLLEILDLLGQRRWRNVEAFRRPRKMQFLGDRHEVTQMAQFHLDAPPRGHRQVERPAPAP